jgi:hypothetical protein
MHPFAQGKITEFLQSTHPNRPYFLVFQQRNQNSTVAECFTNIVKNIRPGNSQDQ